MIIPKQLNLSTMLVFSIDSEQTKVGGRWSMVSSGKHYLLHMAYHFRIFIQNRKRSKDSKLPTFLSRYLYLYIFSVANIILQKKQESNFCTKVKISV